MKTGKIFIFIAFLLALFSCDREYYVDSVEGTWQLDNVSIVLRTPMGETIESSSLKEIMKGLLSIVKPYFQDNEEDWESIEESIDEMDDVSLNFAEESTFQLMFYKDGTFKSCVKLKDDENFSYSDPGEYSYANYRLTMYSDPVDGVSTSVPCTVLKLTNKQLVIQTKPADMLSLSAGGALFDEGDLGGEEGMMIMSMLRMIDLSTELIFIKVKK